MDIRHLHLNTLTSWSNRLCHRFLYRYAQLDSPGPTSVDLSMPAILIFYSPKRVQEAFWSQILTIYSLLLTCLVSLFRGDLTRFHALVVLALVLSPITVYFVAYAIRSFWSAQHRLESLLGRTRYLRRFIVLLAGAAWLAIFIYTYLPKAQERFAQASCKGRSVMEFFYLIVPFVYLAAFISVHYIYPLVLFLLPVFAMIAAWIIAIYLRREEIWPPGEPYRPRFVKVWSVIFVCAARP